VTWKESKQLGYRHRKSFRNNQVSYRHLLKVHIVH